MLFFITWGQRKAKVQTAPRRKSPSSINTSQVRGKKAKVRHSVSGVIGFARPRITGGVHYSFCGAGFKKGREEKSMAYLPHLGSSFPLVSAANWRQVLICCHRNWCINPRAPSLWCRGQYGWTSLSWNKWLMRKVLWKGSHVSYFTSAHGTNDTCWLAGLDVITCIVLCVLSFCRPVPSISESVLSL